MPHQAQHEVRQDHRFKKIKETEKRAVLDEMHEPLDEWMIFPWAINDYSLLCLPVPSCRAVIVSPSATPKATTLEL
jgi:hypothetical protein